MWGFFYRPAKIVSIQLSVISYQLSVISYQLSAISYQLSAISYQLSVISFVAQASTLGDNEITLRKCLIYLKKTGWFGFSQM
ncbi:hypothetical protein BJP34_12460 [Moorena producens PAL-8-15-08-1]|uniref:Uncharacterized protein n=1 Tax=Moorena producens PAL-8-15-08-1 TaxID=1458985 RepID=A0A1D8TRG6_9CYAN|nr:hypothetical protein BJP34_12460 [Moorena producens PAL-8-15-08-1]